MSRLTRRQALAALGTSTLVGGMGGLALDIAEAEPPSPRELLQRRHLPNVELVTQAGRNVRFYDDLARDKKILINFMYTTCTGICSPVTANLVQVAAMLGGRIGNDIFMYSVTLTPRQDTPPVLRDYAAMHGVGAGWQFLTGAPDDVEALRRGLGFTYQDPIEDADRDSHIGMLRYGDEPMMRWAGCPALGAPEHIVRNIAWEFGVQRRPGATPPPSHATHHHQHSTA